MGKRSNMKRLDKDAYATPPAAVLPLLPHLLDQTVFHEPCAGNAFLVEALEAHGHICRCASDITPVPGKAIHTDAFFIADTTADMFITNPPWTRKILHPLIAHLSNIAPTWLLLDADWMHTLQAIPYLARCEKIVSIGRVKWIKDSKFTGKDNSCWYLFGNRKTSPIFYPRFFQHD
ncbi:hypothetical protein LCGC14_2971540 [marine sediment metagenome]|uniref:Uncharacterized protein n=1 Tax=marine sediment metagenome TaxID=412755 RepID=A0A0F8X980_9ZZZZ